MSPHLERIETIQPSLYKEMFPTMTFSSFYTLFIIMVAFVILSGKEKIIYPSHNHGLHYDTEK